MVDFRKALTTYLVCCTLKAPAVAKKAARAVDLMSFIVKVLQITAKEWHNPFRR
jgi:hypothetical protein